MHKPWENEPDYAAWQDAETGLQCLIKRHTESGHLCGYVAVSALHPLHFVDCDDPRVQELDVHGGVTYTGSDEPCRWLIGFDCAHLGDLTPWMAAHGKTQPSCELFPEPVYRTFDYVREQCLLLAKQLAALA